jgi:malate synthase
VWESKQRECKIGLDGALVADPLFVDVVFEAFKDRPTHSFFHLLDRSVDRGTFICFDFALSKEIFLVFIRLSIFS